MREPNPSHPRQRVSRLPELVCRIDPQGRFTYVNPRSCLAICLQPAQQLLGRAVHSAIVPGAGRDVWVEALQAVLDKAQTVQTELPCRTQRAEHQCKCAFLPEMTPAGEIAAVTVIATDFLDQNALSDAAADRRAKNAFMSNMSHELRTPLAGMLNLVELIGENPQKNCTGENIELILEAGQQLKSMISTLLNALQNESGVVIDNRTKEPRKVPPGESIIDALTHLGPLRVLVVEDNYINLLAFRQTLEQSGFSVQEAMNGEEALACLQREPFDLVLMDVQMPVMDGLEATRRIRASGERRLRETRVIALTGYSMSDDRQRIMQAGVDGIITKPIDTDDLTRTLKELFPRNP